jgi:hypothetical protein
MGLLLLGAYLRSLCSTAPLQERQPFAVVRRCERQFLCRVSDACHRQPSNIHRRPASESRQSGPRNRLQGMTDATANSSRGSVGRWRGRWWRVRSRRQSRLSGSSTACRPMPKRALSGAAIAAVRGMMVHRHRPRGAHNLLPPSKGRAPASAHTALHEATEKVVRDRLAISRFMLAQSLLHLVEQLPRHDRRNADRYPLCLIPVDPLAADHFLAFVASVAFVILLK